MAWTQRAQQASGDVVNQLTAASGEFPSLDSRLSALDSKIAEVTGDLDLGMFGDPSEGINIDGGVF